MKEGEAYPIWIESIRHGHEHTHSAHEASNQDTTPTRLEVRVLLWSEDSEDVVVFVQWFAVVATFLLVPPVAVGVAELTFDGKGGC